MGSGEIQIFRFTRHVWGINSSPCVALMAPNRLVADNPTQASIVTLNAIIQDRYMVDLLLADDTLSDGKTFTREGIELFKSRRLKLRKWVTNGHAKSVLLQVSQGDHAPSVGKIDIGSQPLPDSTALGLSRDSESDTLKIGDRMFVEAATRREMVSPLSSQFDPLGIVAPLILGES